MFWEHPKTFSLPFNECLFGKASPDKRVSDPFLPRFQ